VLGGGGTTGGAVALRILSAVAFASVIAAGLLLNAARATVRDLRGELGRGRTGGKVREVPAPGSRRSGWGWS